MWKIQSTIAINFTSSYDNDEEHSECIKKLMR